MKREVNLDTIRTSPAPSKHPFSDLDLPISIKLFANKITTNKVRSKKPKLLPYPTHQFFI
jgi:hypothetical protein